MTTISTAHAALLTTIAATLTSARRLANPYVLAENPGGLLENGYGVAIGPAGAGRASLTCEQSFERAIAVVLTRTAAGTENNADALATVEKALVEDQVALIQALAEETATFPATYVSDGGVEFVQTQDRTGRYYALVTEFALKYSESLS